MAQICPVCDKKISIFDEEWVRIDLQKYLLHRDCVKEFESQPGKYLEETKSDRSEKSEPGDKDFITTLLLCIFLGGLGVHRFFVDKMGTGVLMLVTLGGLGIWWIIDIILIVTNSFEDSEGRVIAYQPAGTANREPAKDIPDEIRKFAELKKDGLITEEEFDKKKKELLK